MCGPTQTTQGKFATIDTFTPGSMISGFDTQKPTLRHTLAFNNTALPCNGAPPTATLKRYKFLPSEYQPIKDWLDAGGQIRLYGELAADGTLKPAGWKGVGL